MTITAAQVDLVSHVIILSYLTLYWTDHGSFFVEDVSERSIPISQPSATGSHPPHPPLPPAFRARPPVHFHSMEINSLFTAKATKSTTAEEEEKSDHMWLFLHLILVS